MNKTKLAICMKDLEYQTRFVSCFMNHYNHQYELHVFTSPTQMEESSATEYAAIISGEYNMDEMAIFVEKGKIILALEENFSEEGDGKEERIVYTEKYQEVYKIAERIERLLVDQIPAQRRIQGAEYKMIGVYSLTQEIYQAPFAALLGKIYGEKHKVLILDLQGYSGLNEMEEGMSSMGLEDLLSVSLTGNYSKSRLLESIRHEFNWDCVCSVQNNQCLAEGGLELYQELIKMLVQEVGYEVIIVNFGTLFLGQLDMMELCQTIYLLNGKSAEGSWRERVFERELLRQGKASLMQNLHRIEIPQHTNKESTWRELVEKWAWGQLGEVLRQGIKKEITYGAVM